MNMFLELPITVTIETGPMKSFYQDLEQAIQCLENCQSETSMPDALL